MLCSADNLVIFEKIFNEELIIKNNEINKEKSTAIIIGKGYENRRRTIRTSSNKLDKRLEEKIIVKPTLIVSPELYRKHKGVEV